MGDRGATALVMDPLALHHPGRAISVRTAYVRDVNFAATGLLPFFPALIDTDVLSVMAARGHPAEAGRGEADRRG